MALQPQNQQKESSAPKKADGDGKHTQPDAPKTPAPPSKSGAVAAASKEAAKKPALDAYFVSVSRLFRICKHISLGVLVLFLLFSFTFLRKDITLENLRYLLKFISFTNTETSISATKINYTSGEINRLELFVGDLCTLTPTGYSIYDSRGNQIMSEDVSYASPVLKVSAKFSLCYDLGGTGFKIFNTFTKLYEDNGEFPISDASISDTGSFAVASASRDHHTAVTVYNSDFKPTVKILRKNRLMALEFRPDGSELALMTMGAVNGDFVSTVEVIVPGETEARYRCELNALGYSLYITDIGYCVVTDTGISYFNDKLELIKTVEHPSQITMTECAGSRFVALYSNGLINNSYRAVIYDTSGEELYSETLMGRPVAIDHAENGSYIFIHTGDEVLRVNLLDKTHGRLTVAPDAIDLLASSPTTVLAAYENYALTYELENFEEQPYRHQNKPVGEEAVQ